jgi:hypothetical protein
MIKMKGRAVTFTGKDEKNLKELAALLGKTPQETLELAITEHMKQFKAAKKSPFVYESDLTTESTIKPVKRPNKRK